MAVFRVEKTKDFTIMSNHHLRNTESVSYTHLDVYKRQGYSCAIHSHLFRLSNMYLLGCNLSAYFLPPFLCLLRGVVL